MTKVSEELCAILEENGFGENLSMIPVAQDIYATFISPVHLPNEPPALFEMVLFKNKDLMTDVWNGSTFRRFYSIEDVVPEILRLRECYTI
uniref:Uncharacterized protein n=1 Tax=Marseillevirus LCMAC202 TaxID=2506606 RepID=A0A481YYK7_9VIRU|nr:MAG: hypothetical protein LCMAC202_02760 [Marseillevirus LCMAC202]